MRIAVKDQLFTAMYFSETQVFPDLLLLIYRTDTNSNPIETLEPLASTLQLGLQHVNYVFTSSGPHVLKWYSAAEGLIVYETVMVLETEDRYPMHSVVSVGAPYYPEFHTTSGADVTCHVFTPEYIDTDDSPFSFEELGTGFYRATAPLVPEEVGPHLVTWYVDDAFDSYQVYDVYQPVTARAVTLAFRVTGTRVPYQGLHVTVVRVDGNYSATGFTRADGKLLLMLNDADYYVVIRDKNNPTRVFTMNNFELDVCDPTTRSSANDVVWDIDWLDNPVSDEIVLPSEFKSVMHVSILAGPSGIPAAYRMFTISTEAPMRVNGSVIAAGTSQHSLDVNGDAAVTLIRNARVRVSFPMAGISTTFDVPDEASFNFSDVVGSDPFAVMTPAVFFPYKTS